MGRRVLKFDGPLARGLWYRRFTAMSFICRLPAAVVTGLTFPPDTVILSRRRRILVRGAYEAIGINTGQREGCRLAARSALRIISTCHVVHPLPLRGIPLKGTQDVTGLASCPHSHSERSEESWYAAYLRQSALNTGQREGCRLRRPNFGPILRAPPSSIPVGQSKGKPFYGQVKGQLCPTWQSYAGLPPVEGALRYGIYVPPHRHSERQRRISVRTDSDTN